MRISVSNQMLVLFVLYQLLCSLHLLLSASRTFRADEFEFGEILGKGFFGQVHKVRRHQCCKVIVF